MMRSSELALSARRGFTLIEVALAIFIMGLLLTGIVLPLRAQLELRMLEETRSLLARAREALLGYAAMYGHFPCPADATSNGYEPAGTQTRREEDTAPICNPYIGFLPAAELGMTPIDSEGYASDGWGGTANRIRYAVTNATIDAVPEAFVSTNGMHSVGIEMLGSADLLHVCASGSGVVPGANCGPLPGNVITTKAAVVIWSVGPNALTGGVSVDERENPNPTAGFSLDRIFVSRPQSDASGAEFDDVLTWIPLPLIVTRMVAAGHLP
jgi:prepilin-type N-terminal cleavage/methylation domain-containing protein